MNVKVITATENNAVAKIAQVSVIGSSEVKISLI